MAVAAGWAKTSGEVTLKLRAAENPGEVTLKLEAAESPGKATLKPRAAEEGQEKLGLTLRCLHTPKESQPPPRV